MNSSFSTLPTVSYSDFGLKGLLLLAPGMEARGSLYALSLFISYRNTLLSLTTVSMRSRKINQPAGSLQHGGGRGETEANWWDPKIMRMLQK